MTHATKESEKTIQERIDDGSYELELKQLEAKVEQADKLIESLSDEQQEQLAKELKVKARSRSVESLLKQEHPDDVFMAAKSLGITQPAVTASMQNTESNARESNARTMTEDGRAADGKALNPGDVFKTSSGRTTTPFPKQKSQKYTSQWLIDNAAAEAEARGDTFNAPIFKATTINKKGELTPEDGDSLNAYLFGEQPASCTAPLTRQQKHSLKKTP